MHLTCMIIVHKKLINIQSVSIPVMVHRSCLNLVLIVHVLCTYHVRVVNQSYFSTVHQLCLIFELQEDHQHVLDYAAETLASCRHSRRSRKYTLYFKMTLWVEQHESKALNMSQTCCVPGCMNIRLIRKMVLKLSFHKFPEDKELFRKWIVVIQRDIGKEFRVTNYLRICSRPYHRL